MKSVARQNKKIVLADAVVLILSFLIVTTFLHLCSEDKNTNFEDAATFGANTTTIMPSVGKYKIHCADDRDVENCIDGFVNRGSRNSVIWLGNSQLHAINQWKEGEINAPMLLHQKIDGVGLDLLTFSQPNANLQEHYILFQYLITRIPTIKTLILPIVFDDLREEGIRENIKIFTRDPKTRLVIEGDNKLKFSQKNEPKTDGIEKAEGKLTPQNLTESFFTDWLDDISSIWRSRAEMRGQIFTGLYLLRNYIFGINPSSKRKIIPSHYRNNFEFLNGIIESAEKNKIQLIIYIAPIRSDIEIPYDDSEYSKFKDEVKKLADSRGVIYRNFEDIVPPKSWGIKDSTKMGGAGEVDFMHFQASGHKLLANHLSGLINEKSQIQNNNK